MNIKEIRKDFPILRQKINGKPLVYLDSACMTLKPQQVIDAMNSYYYNFTACGGLGRSNHFFGKRVDEEVYKAREKIMKYINARPCRDAYRGYTPTKEIVFTKNTTESINLIARSFPFSRNSAVLTTDREHSSNLCPWKELEKSGIIRYICVSSNEDNTFNFERFENILKKEKVELISMVHISNLDGYEIPAEKIIKTAHKYGAKVLLDGAQSAPHISIDIQKLDVDFLAFSLHKMCGPTGIGILYGKENLLNNFIKPFIVGGDTVEDTFLDKEPIYLDSPFKYEAGLQNYSGIIGTGCAIDYISNIGIENINIYIKGLPKFLTNKLEKFKNEFEIIGPEEPDLHNGIITLCFKKRGIVSLFDRGISGIGAIFNTWKNIMVRSGEFCVHSWFNEKKISREREKIRISLYFYNTIEECELFIKTLEEILNRDEYKMLPKII